MERIDLFMVVKSIEEQINKLLKDGKFDKQISEIVKTKGSSLNKDLLAEVKKLQDCILSHITSKTTRNSVKIKSTKDGAGYEIYFDEVSGTLPSAFKNYRERGIGFYAPLALNEGFLVKGGFFKDIGAEAQYFIEHGIKDYISKYGNNLKITVNKNWDIQYTKKNKTITSVTIFR